jgi:hypothetical protein
LTFARTGSFPILFRIQDAGVFDMQYGIGGELLIAQLKFDCRIDVELPQPNIAAADRRFIDSEPAVEVENDVVFAGRAA